MFFNENLLLEGDDVEMTDDEIKEAAEQSKADELDKQITEGADFYTYGLEQMAILDEGYYNLREKMMNVEHIAAMKDAEGLVSESEMILEASFDGFVNGLKKFFEKLLNVIKNLFNRFVEFIMSLFVSVKKIKNANAEEAFNAYIQRNKEFKAKVFNFSYKDLLSTIKTYAQLGKETEDMMKTVIGTFKKAKGAQSAKDIAESIEETIGTAPKKLADRFDSRNDIVSKLIGKVTEENVNTGEKENFLVKTERKIEKDEYKSRVEFIIKYDGLIREVGNSKKAADKAIKEAIKDVNEMKNPSKGQQAVQGKVIKALKWGGSVLTKKFSKVTSLASQYYRESLQIARRVMGGNMGEDIKNKAKDLTKSEGFDYEAYFTGSFN